MGNTVGRLSKVDSLHLSYIAGFLDGDGSIMLQLHRRVTGKEVFRVKTVICFYQNSRYLKEIKWMKNVLGCGYVYIRNDMICELRIEGFQKVFEVLTLLRPYLRLKSKQADLLLKVIPRIQQKILLKEDIPVWINKMQNLNYFSAQRKTLVDVPVTTES